jgi:3-oxoacyl-[acyl-carrier-protein] synthase III
VGLLTGWGAGVAALPDDAVRAAGGRAVVPAPPPAAGGERFRRATRECRLAVAAVEAALAESGLAPDAVAGPATALVYVTAAAYGASNAAFAAGAGSTLHFPYTAPSAVPGEVAIHYGLTGAYVILLGGPATTIDALWQAGLLLAGGGARRALVVAVETFEECAALWARGRWATPRPLVEAAACAVLEPGGPAPAYQSVGAAPSALEAAAERRAGATLACQPLVALALARRTPGPVRVSGWWRGRRAALTLEVAATA